MMVLLYLAELDLGVPGARYVCLRHKSVSVFWGISCISTTGRFICQLLAGVIGKLIKILKLFSQQGEIDAYRAKQ